MSTEVKDSDTQDAIATIDFSSVTKLGTYYLKRGKLQSAPFRIATDIYEQLLIIPIRVQKRNFELRVQVSSIQRDKLFQIHSDFENYTLERELVLPYYVPIKDAAIAHGV